MKIDIQQRTAKKVQASTGRSATAGGVEIEFVAAVDDDCRTHLPPILTLRFFSEDDAQEARISPEDLELAAELMRQIRAGLGDYSPLCAVHGYIGYLQLDCQKCTAEEPKAEGSAPAAPAALEG